MGSQKVLSIIVPTYNAEAFLDKCLSSFLVKDRECLGKVQVIVVNDGSPDQSARIAQEYVARYPDVYQLLSKENGGHGSGINAGVEAAEGKYFKVIDADDWADTGELEKLIAVLEKSTADAVVTNYKTYHVQTKVCEEKKLADSVAGKTLSLDEMMRQWSDVEWGMTFHGIAYRTDFYRTQNYKVLEGVFYEDQEYATVPMCAAKKIQFEPLYVYMYRIGDAAQSVAIGNQIRRLPQLEKVILRVLEKEERLADDGAKKYWTKKTSMIITSYYMVALLDNKEKAQGRRWVRRLNEQIAEKSPDMSACVKKKCRIFMIMSISNLV